MTEVYFKYKCHRCPAVDELPMSIEDVKANKTPPSIKDRRIMVKLGGTEVVDHGYLCNACLEIVGKHIEAIGRKVDKVASTRKVTKRRKKKSNGAAEEPEVEIEIEK